MVLRSQLGLRQGQALVMTPQLQQAVKLLQLSGAELTEFIEKEIVENPLLEREEANAGLEDGHADPVDNDPPSHNGDSELAFYDDGTVDPIPTDDPALGNTEILSGPACPIPSDGAAADLGSDESERLNWTKVSAGVGGFDDDLSWLENTAAEKPTLRDHLIGQVNVDFEDPIEVLIAYRLIDMLDENGWLSGELEVVALALGCTIGLVEQTLKKCQQMDPPGIFGRTLAECLALQLREKDRLDPAMQALLYNLQLLGRQKFSQLCHICCVDMEDLLQMVAEIKALNPRPASKFAHEVIQHVVPDVFARRTKEGWAVDLNIDLMPRVLVNKSFYATVRRHARTKEDKEFLRESFQSADWLVRALHQRAETILKVASELVTQQEEFFEKGVAFLKPLTLREVAEEVGVHESTVSRVTSNKYLSMSRGIFEMKFFFSSSIRQSGEAPPRSAEAVRFRIKSLIDREAPEGILSDDRIVGILREEGIDIARRTVAKYRDVMHIPSSVQRRREKAVHA